MTNDIQKKDAQLPRYRQPSDIVEREDGFHIFMDMPGVSREALVIDLKENELVVSGSAAAPVPEGERLLDMEYGGAEYRRAFQLSDSVDREGIKAHLEHGVLELHLPKAEKALPRRIEIQAG